MVEPEWIPTVRTSPTQRRYECTVQDFLSPPSSGRTFFNCYGNVAGIWIILSQFVTKVVKRT